MLTQLAQETQRHHGPADGDRLAIMEKPTAERYRSFLAQIYCFEAPFEAACLATEGLDRSLVRAHSKAQRLAADLEALGFARVEVQSTATLRFDGCAEALGWMWVVHRNTLLHGLIYRYLQGKLPDCMRAAGAYLSAFEGRAGALMRELGEALDATAKGASTARIIAAAHDAFRTQRHAYKCDELGSRGASAPRTITPRQAA